MRNVLRRVCAGHPDNGVHVAVRDLDVAAVPAKAHTMCGQTLRNVIWLQRSPKPVDCNACKAEVVTRYGKKRS